MLDGPWAAATSNDLRFPQAVGVRRPVDPALAAHLSAVRAATATDVEVARAFIRVFQLVDPASALAAPEIVARIAALNRGRKAHLTGPNDAERDRLARTGRELS